MASKGMTDSEALDYIAGYMAAQEEWDTANICEMVAERIAATGRVGPDQPVTVVDYLLAAQDTEEHYITTSLLEGLRDGGEGL